MLEGHLVECFHELAGLLKERQQSGMFDLVDAHHLPDHQLAVAMDEELFAPLGLGQFQGAEQGRVLGYVIGGVAEKPRLFEVRLAASFQHDGPRRRARIAASAAVGVDDEFVFGIHRDSIWKVACATAGVLGV